MKFLNKTFLLGPISAIILSGCSTVTEMHTSGGSKSDGVVEMAYQYAPLQPVNIDKQKALRDATKRCQSWGYKNAESFDAGKRTCIWGDFLGCNSFQVTVKYQCLND